MARHDRMRGTARRAASLIALAGALALGGCYDDGYNGYGYAGSGAYDGGYGYAGYYDGWPGYGWYDGFYYPGSGIFAYDRRGGRHHWSGPGGRGWHGAGGGHWASNGSPQHHWNGRGGGSGRTNGAATPPSAPPPLHRKIPAPSTAISAASTATGLSPPIPPAPSPTNISISRNR